MNATSPTHEEVTRRAQEIWKARGCPAGSDIEIWLEAEQQLTVPATVQNPLPDAPVRGDGNSQGSGAAGDPTAPDPTPGGAVAKAARQKKAARAPKLPGKSAPKASPPETGKPLWDKPHSA